jgi:chromosome segregation ATPase
MKTLAAYAVATSVATQMLLGTTVSTAEASDNGTRSYKQLENEFNTSHEKYKALAKQLEQTIAEAEKRFARLREEKKSIQADVARMENDIEDLLKVKAKRQDELNEVESTAAGLEKRLNTLLGRVPTYEEAAKTAEVLAEREKELEDAQARYRAVSREKETIARDSLETIRDLQAALEHQQRRVAELEDERKSLAGQTASLRDELREEREERAQTEKENATISAELTQMRDKFASFRKDLASLRESESNLRKALRGTEVTAANLADKLEKEQERTHQLERDYKQAAETRSELQASLEDLRSERADLRERVEAQTLQLGKLRNRLDETEQAKRQAVSDAKSSMQLLESFLSRQEALMSDLEKVKRNIADPRS